MVHEAVLNIERDKMSALMCMAVAIFFEARNQEVDGMLAVGQVIENRVYDKRWPDNVCDVVHENRTGKKHQCQFSFYCDGLHDDPTKFTGYKDIQAWTTAQLVAAEILNNDAEFFETSTHYHTTGVNPKWNASMKVDGREGVHIFYTE